MENENVVTQQETQVTVEPAPVQTQQEKKGLTSGQKALGGTVIGLAIGGLVGLIMLIIKGVKWLWSKTFGKKKAEPAPVQDQKQEPEKPAEPVTPEEEKKAPEQNEQK